MYENRKLGFNDKFILTTHFTPLITIETESFNLLVKESYNGNTVAMKVPTHRTTNNGNGMTPNDTTF